MSQNEAKRLAAEKAIEYVEDGMIVGVGTGSTVAFFIDALGRIKHRIAGLARVASIAYPDETQFDPKSHYFDEKATREQPRWFLVDVAFERKLKRLIPLEEIKGYTDELGEGFALTA